MYMKNKAQYVSVQADMDEYGHGRNVHMYHNVYSKFSTVSVVGKKIGHRREPSIYKHLQ